MRRWSSISNARVHGAWRRLRGGVATPHHQETEGSMTKGEDQQADAVTPTSHRLIRMRSHDGRRSAAPKGARAPDVRVCSAPEAARLRPSRRAVVIAIRDPGAPVVQLRSGRRAVLCLEVPDVGPSGELAPVVDLSDVGEAVAEFVTANRNSAGTVLHCHLGVSRSRSVAAALGGGFAWPYQWTVLHESCTSHSIARCVTPAPVRYRLMARRTEIRMHTAVPSSPDPDFGI